MNERILCVNNLQLKLTSIKKCKSQLERSRASMTNAKRNTLRMFNLGSALNEWKGLIQIKHNQNGPYQIIK